MERDILVPNLTKEVDMFQITLILRELLDDATHSDRELRGIVTRTCVPGVGDMITIGGNQYPVTLVEHNLNVDPSAPEATRVLVDWWEGNFETLVGDPRFKLVDLVRSAF